MTGPLAPGWLGVALAAQVGAVVALAWRPAPATPEPEPSIRLPERMVSNQGGGGHHGRHDDHHGPDGLWLQPDYAVVLGALDKAEVAQVIQRNRQQLLACFQNARDRSPKVVGWVNTHFLIGPKGKLQAIDLKSALGDAELERCLAWRFYSWEFPVPREGKPVEVLYPFALWPRESPPDEE